MELRAIELSRKMAELSGEEPVQIIQPRSVESLELQKPKAETTTVNFVEPVPVSAPSVKLTHQSSNHMILCLDHQKVIRLPTQNSMRIK